MTCNQEVGRALREPALVATLPEPVPVSALSGDDPARKLYRNKCAVSSRPAGHPDACNDCDPCLFGAAPSLWCGKCGGRGWLRTRRCYICGGSGFEPSDRDASLAEDAKRLSGEAVAARAGTASPKSQGNQSDGGGND